MHLPAPGQSLHLDLVSFVQHRLTSSVEDISGRQVIQRFMVALVIVIVYELTNTFLEFARQVVVFQQNPVLQ